MGLSTIQGAVRPWHFSAAMKVWVCQVPNGTEARKRSPRGEQPVRLVSFVLVDVSSMNTSLDRALLKKGLRRVIQSRRSRAISGRLCSLA